MEEEREVQKERAIEFAKQHAIHKVFETSAKTGDMVEEVFSCAAKELFLQTEKEDVDTRVMSHLQQVPLPERQSKDHREQN